MKKILIAGGSGFIGSELKNHFLKSGDTVFILTRNPKKENDIYWDPKNKKIETSFLSEIDVLINLCGANIAEKKWSAKRKKTLIDSRVESTKFLYSMMPQFSKLSTYIGASGVNCFGNTNEKTIFNEKHPISSDFLSTLIKEWESAHQLFSKKTTTIILRLPVILAKNKGMLKRMKLPFWLGLGSVLGDGQQIINWMSINDLKAAFSHVLKLNLKGTYLLGASNDNNQTFSRSLAKALNRIILLPKTPKWIIKTIFGEMSTLLLNGNYVSSEKFMQTNFTYKDTNIEQVLYGLYTNNVQKNKEDVLDL